ncbi:MAG TPA: phBC6A51 family helix-turn-helix protein [Candidatus Paceibacterota bacterium]|nr:phBC6A51 family helix-turn-helix protein [Candidatus Paceibacterota bacterium]
MDNKSTNTIEERRSKDKEKLLEQLRKMPIIQIACERAGVSRASYYRWRNEDEVFKKAADEALDEGEALITDMSESQLIAMIREKNFQAVQLWLRHHHPKYKQKVEVTANFQTPQEELTPEQEKTVKEALRLASLTVEEPIKEVNQTSQNHEQRQQ